MPYVREIATHTSAAKSMFAFGLHGSQREICEMVRTISEIGLQAHRDQRVAICRARRSRTAPVRALGCGRNTHDLPEDAACGEWLGLRREARLLGLGRRWLELR